MTRHPTHVVNINWQDRHVLLGGDNPIAVQSMTNTPTTQVQETVSQILQLSQAGSELVRLTVNTPQAAKAVCLIREQLDKKNCLIPLVGDFHYNGDKLLKDEPSCARSLSKYRINPGNVKNALAFDKMVEIAIENDKPIRIGVNGGSIDMDLLEKMRQENEKSSTPQPFQKVFNKAIVLSTLNSARRACDLGLKENCIVLSAKMSTVDNLLEVYRDLAFQSHFPLHLGLTEAGIGDKGMIASTAGLSILLNEGIGDTIRVSLTPGPGETRSKEVRVAQDILQSLNLRFFRPMVTSCPGCGRTQSALYQELTALTQAYLDEMTPKWAETCTGFQTMRVAVMGCVVNGPGESKGANIGISLPGFSENPTALVFEDGEKVLSLKGDAKALADAFQKEINNYVLTHYTKL